MIKSVALSGLALLFATAVASAQSGPQSEAIRAACKSDIEKLCSGVEPDAVPECVHEHIDELSESCKVAVQQVRQQDKLGHD